MLFSIIIPAYQTAAYLERCLSSVLSQPFSDYEVILVDDGSDDGTGEICTRFAEANAAIRVFHVPHGGLGYARNIGMKQARGDYILFLDSDDYIAPDSLCSLASAIRGADLYLLRSQKVSQGKILEPLRIVEDYREKDFTSLLFRLIREEALFCSPCDKAVSRRLIVENQICFPENRRNEDILWVAQIITHIRSLGIINEPYYYYEQHRPGSLSRSFSCCNVEDVITSIREALEYCAEAPAEQQKAVFSFLSFQFVWILPYLPICRDAGLVRYMQDNAWLLKSNPSHAWYYNAIRLFGIAAVSRALELYTKWKYAINSRMKRLRR